MGTMREDRAINLELYKLKFRIVDSLKNNAFNLKLFINLILAAAAVLNATQALYAKDTSAIARAGLRSSIYGFNDSYPDTTWWLNATSDMSERFSGTTPSVIWIIGYTENDGAYLNFPKPNNGVTYKKIFFGSTDQNEKYLNFFDRHGIKAWLEVEPGMADIDTLISLVLNQYSHHKCVIGFGVDVEWYKTGSSNNYEGQAVSDSEATDWSARAKSFNKDYLFFLKHWLTDKMPPTFRTGMVFIDDSQEFPDLNSMVSEFVVWAKTFAPSRVGFQYGYDADKSWWNKLSNPPKAIGDALISECTNISDLYWVDFTAYDIWPPNFNPTSVLIEQNQQTPDGFKLFQNYPNPFNPSTNVKFTLAESGGIDLSVYNILGQKVLNIFDNQYMYAGLHEVNINMSMQAAGTYILLIKQNENLKAIKMIFLK